MASDALLVVPGDLTDPRVVELLEYHVTTALAQGPRESCHAFDVSALQRPEISFWAIWEGEALLGIGALMDLGGGHASKTSGDFDVNAYAAKLRGADGAPLWLTSLGDDKGQSAYAVTTDEAGWIFLGGGFGGKLQGSSITGEAAGGQDAFLVRLAP